jgi:hypothetical protein
MKWLYRSPYEAMASEIVSEVSPTLVARQFALAPIGISAARRLDLEILRRGRRSGDV